MWRLLVLALLAACSGCRSPSPPPETSYELRGQVVTVRPEIREVRIAHEEIPGYMPAMTMSFGVKDATLLEGLERGDLVRGTLVVTDTDAWLSTLEATGRAPVPEDPESDASASPPAMAPPDLLEPGQEVPAVTFTDQDARPFSLGDARGRAVALTFIYTRCPLPNFCPRLDRHFLVAQRTLAGRADLRDRVLLVTVSFDPTFDTPTVLKQHAASLGADLGSWRFVTADEATVERFATRFGVSIVRNEGDTLDITHNLRTAVIGPDGRLVKVLSGGDWKPDELVADLAASLAP